MTAYVVAADAGQVAVEDDHVVPVHGQPLEGLDAVENKVDGQALTAQAVGDGLGQDLEILNDEHSHASTLPGRRCQPGVSR
ncbi:hypothetical protein GCM10020218_056030 [Dactylosporangium vinaceum]